MINKSERRSYRIYHDMKRRCTNPKRKDYKHYGGKGIRVSKDWNTYDKFYKDMGEPEEKMELDRIDRNKDYCKENCRWTTRQINVYNRRPSIKSKKNLPVGVSIWSGKRLRYCARCRVYGKSYHIAICDTIEEARKKYEEFCLEWWGFIAN